VTAAQIHAATQRRKRRRRIKPSQHPAENHALLQRVLQHIAKHADLLDDGPRLPLDETDFRHTGEWLIVPVARFMLDALAVFEAGCEDLEDGADHEPTEDEEPSLGSLNTFSQNGWAAGDLDSRWDREADDADDEPNGDLELDRSDFEPDHDDEPDVHFGGQTGSLPVYASEERDRPRPRTEIPAEPITHPVLGVYRRLY